MTTEEHLNKIVAKCRELLAIAESRTPGKWYRDRSGALKGDVRCESSQWIAMTSFCGNSNRGGLPHQDANAAFIASCAGPAEAGWRATIAAIDQIKSLKKGTPTWEWVGAPMQRDIIAAWPEELL